MYQFTIPQAFWDGECFDAYRWMGAHPSAGPRGEAGWQFTLFAPGAKAVSVCGSWPGGEDVPMEKNEAGFWRVYIPGPAEGDSYQYRITGADGSVQLHADPYAFASELRPGTASKLTALAFSFDDEGWMARRDKCRNLPMNIYEMHAGSWKRDPDAQAPDGGEGGWYNYDDLAKELVPWLTAHHYTHVELLPLAEHPFDGSWGYQTTGYFSVTSRYGTPAQFARFVNACHRMGIGVIMDFVPVHFAADAAGLARLDGTCLYEYDSDVGESEWGTHNFNYYRGEVRSFLNSAAALWMDVYHCDGIRMDAISRAIYWLGDPARGVNQGALDFLRRLNHGLNQRWPTGVYIAEGSASKLDAQLDEKQLHLFTDKMNELHGLYFPDADVYCAIVPDKNYYLASGHGYPALDYETLFGTVEAELPWATHIDLTGSLTAADYYATDSHWRQEKLDRVVDMVEPAISAFLTVAVGVTLLSVMLPLMHIMTAIG